MEKPGINDLIREMGQRGYNYGREKEINIEETGMRIK